jgi:predicted Zn-dependent peptidase
VVAVHGPERTLLEVRLAFRTAAGLDGAHAARLVLAEMLDRRAAAVRERLGATYDLDAAYLPGVGPGAILVRGTVDAARGAEALAALRQNLDELRRGERFLEDFVHARDAVLARELAEASDSGTLGERLADIAVFDLPPTFADELVHAVARLGPRDVLDLARAELADEVLVVGGEEAAVAKALAGMTPTKIVDAR